MGRWESTKKIQPFRGAYYFGETKRSTKKDEKRIKEVEIEKDKDALSNPQEMTLAKQQGMDDKYGKPQVQAQKSYRSVAEKVDIISENVDSDDGKTEEEHEQEIKKEKKRAWYTILNNDRAMKIAERCDVELWVNSKGELESNDPLIVDLICEERLNADNAIVPLNYSEQIESIVKQWKQMRLNKRSIDDANYLVTLDHVRRFYGINECVSNKGNPLGNYSILIDKFNICYDFYRSRGLYPSVQDVIKDLNPTMRSMHKDVILREFDEEKYNFDVLEWRAKVLSSETGIPLDICIELSN